MPKKKHPETPEDQAKRFREEAEKLIKSGELDPAEGAAATDKLVRRAAPRRPAV
jgi:hypothetical protein